MSEVVARVGTAQLISRTDDLETSTRRENARDCRRRRAQATGGEKSRALFSLPSQTKDVVVDCQVAQLALHRPARCRNHI